MDGGGRFLGSLTEQLAALIGVGYPRPLAFAHPLPPGAYPSRVAPRPEGPRARLSLVLLRALARFAARPGVGAFTLLMFFVVVVWTAFVHNGGYADLVAREGVPRDILARAAGFKIAGVTIGGQTQLSEAEVLAASGVGAKESLLFLDPAAVRERLLALPLVKSARVMKLYPDRLVIAIEERQPFALWQQDGHISVVAVDGKAIDELRDERFLGLPFVVGAGAEKRLTEYAALIAAAGDLAPRVKAGVYVAGRRWTLDMTNGVSVKLPETDPVTAVTTLTRLQREARILDKDILSIDLRAPGRVAVRLSEEGLATRAAGPQRSVKSKAGGHT
jgi:cell division protein FtsQ